MTISQSPGGVPTRWIVIRGPSHENDMSTALTDDPVQADGPDWSPDGTMIAFTSLRHGQNADGTWNREICVMAADGSAQVRLTEDPPTRAHRPGRPMARASPSIPTGPATTTST